MTHKHAILFVPANPGGLDRAGLDEEARAIQVELERSGQRDRFAFATLWAPEPLDLLRELRRLRPTVVHYCGPSGEHGLPFHAADRPARVSSAALAQAFGAAGSSVQLVVLSACYSASHAEALLAHVDCVVGVAGAISPGAARSFAIGFYGGLAGSESIAAAFAQGCAAISLEPGRPRAGDGGEGGAAGDGPPGTPELKVRNGIDAAQLVLGHGGLVDRDRTEALDGYLAWLRAVHGVLELRGIRGLPQAPRISLDSVYVALRGDRTTAYERMQDRELGEAELRELAARRAGELGELAPGEQLDELRQRLLRDQSVMLSQIQRDRPLDPAVQVPTTVVTLAEAFCNERWLVILGDPGGGKTTLARWLAGTLATARPGETRITVPAGQVDAEAADPAALVDLGPARLPVLLRVADFVEDHQRTGCSLLDHLCHHRWLRQPPTAHGEPIAPDRLDRLIRYHLRRGELVLILDGMDEVVTVEARDLVLREIEAYIDYWVPGSGRPGDAGGPPTAPARTGGNQVVITSRIAGYRAAPVRGDLTHVTIERMTQAAVERFCDAWTRATVRLLDGDAPDDVIAERAAAQSALLKAAIFDPARPGIRELATNPLLVTILAMVHRGAGELPQRRAELYRLAMEILIEDLRKTRWAADEIAFVLSPLAAHIHERYANGLIGRTELRELVTARLAELRGLDPARPPVAFRRDVDAFMRIVREDVGLLAARGESIYGFLHLTFQEYLAGLDLVRDPASAASRIVPRLGDPRWREPVLLALGHVATAAPGELERLLDALLDVHDPAGFLPTVPLFLVSALGELASIPAGCVRRLARALLHVAGELAGLGRHRRLAAQVERALDRLWELAPREIEVELCAVLGAPRGGDACAAAAALIDARAWYSERIVAALIAAQPRDTARGGFAIHRAMRTLLAARDSSPEPAQPRLPEGAAALRDSDPRRYGRLQRRLQIASAAHGARVARNDRLRAARQIELPVEGLRMRHALGEPALVAWLRGHLGWLRVIVALHGGYFDHGTAEIVREWRELARFLGRSTAARDKHIQAEEDAFVSGRWGGDVDDITMAIATYLDEHPVRTLVGANDAPAFSPDAIGRDCALTGHLLAALRDRASEGALRALLASIWNAAGSDALRADAFVGMVALGEAPAAPAPDTSLGHAIQRALGLAAYALRDPAVRALTMMYELPAAVPDPLDAKRTIARRRRWAQILDELEPAVSAQAWGELLRALATLSVEIAGEPVSDHLLFARPSVAATAELIAGYLVVGDVERPIPCAARAVSHLYGGSPSHVIAALYALPWSANLALHAARGGLDRTPLPRLRSAQEIPVELVDMMESLHAGSVGLPLDHELPAVFASHAARIAGSSRRWVELLAFGLRYSALHSWVAEGMLTAVGVQDTARYTVAGLLELARGLRDRVARSRALVRLVRRAPSRGELRAEAAAAARRISDAHERFRVLASLAPLCAGAERAEVIDRAHRSARSIRDADDRARALARVGSWKTRDDRTACFEAAVDAAASVRPEWQRAGTLAVIRDLVRQSPRASTRLDAEVARLQAPASRWHARGEVGSVLLVSAAAVRTRSPSDDEIWQPLVLAGLVRDQIAEPGDRDTPEALWRELAWTGSESVIARLCELGIAGGLTLTRDAVYAVDTVAQADLVVRLRPLLPLLQDLSDSGLGIAVQWLEHDEPLRGYAALYLAEAAGRPTPATLPGVLAALSSRDDRTRARAVMLLWAGDPLIKREWRRFRASELGADVVTAIYAALALDHRRPVALHGLSLVSLDIVHDDPSLISAAVADARAGGELTPGALRLLREIYEATPEVWGALKTAYAAGPPGIRAAIVESFAHLANHDNKQAHTEDLGPFLAATPSEGVESHRFVPGGPLAVARAAREVLAARPGAVVVDMVDAAEAALAGWVETLSNVLSRPAEDITAALSGFANTALGYSFQGRFYARPEDAAAVLQDDEPRMLELLMLWARRVSRSLAMPGEPWFSRMTCWLVFSVLEVHALRSPAAFANLAGKHGFEVCLADVIRAGTNASREALVLLGLLQRASPRTVAALQASLLKGDWVEDHALAAFEQLRQIDAAQIEGLAAQLFDTSALVAASAAQVLASLARSDRVDSAQRRRIIDALTAAIRDPRSARGIYAPMPRASLRDLFLGRLDERLADLLGTIVGTADV